MMQSTCVDDFKGFIYLYMLPEVREKKRANRSKVLI